MLLVLVLETDATFWYDTGQLNIPASKTWVKKKKDPNSSVIAGDETPPVAQISIQF